MIVGRFAPSPSGEMHLGNARTALLAWLDVRSRGGRMLLRIEDLDRERCRPQYADGVRRDLRWLGLDWDRETTPQSGRDDAYHAAVRRLRDQCLVFECYCSRRDLAVLSAPHGPAGERRYPGRCRDLTGAEREQRRAQGRRPALRVILPDDELVVRDRLRGSVVQNVGNEVGPIVVRRADGLYAYHLAVVVDDAADGVTEVLRGDDLLHATPRHVALQRLLGLPAPRYAHVPLVLGADGERLAKRHGAPGVAALRQAGVPATRVVGLLAATLGLAGNGADLTPEQLLADFRLEAIDSRPAPVPAQLPQTPAPAAAPARRDSRRRV